MPPSLAQIEQEIARRRRDLDDWLAQDGILDRRYCGEHDAGYPDWGEIESLAGTVFDHELTQQLGASSIDSLLFFVSRSDECGVIIASLSAVTGSPFSGCGRLSYSDLLFLCEQALERAEDLCDYQLAASFRKCESLDDRAVGFLLRFFDRKDSYTRRTALHAFQQFAHPFTVELAQKLWVSDDCEFAKLSCLAALKEFPEARAIFDASLLQYRSMYDVDAEEYRRSHLKRLTS